MVVNKPNNVVATQEFYKSRKATGLFTFQMGRGDRFANMLMLAGSVMCLGAAAFGLQNMVQGTNRKEGY